MSKGRQTPPRTRERKRPSPCKCVRDGLPAALSELVATTSRVLFRSTEGMEDWDEWVAVRNALMVAAKHADDYDRRAALDRITDFDERRRRGRVATTHV